MPIMNQRPGTSRPNSRPSAPSYNRRANSNRRDIRMDNSRRRNNQFPKLLIILILLVGIFAGSAVLLTSMGRKDGNSKSVSTAPEEAAHEELPSAEPQEELPEESPEESEALSEEPLDVTQEGLIYTDDRVPNYTAANPLWQTLHFAWESQNKRGTVQVDISIDSEMYRYYRGLGRYYGADEYQNYVNDANNKKIAAELVSAIRSASNSGAQSDAAVVREIAKFVQDTITYQYDLDTTGEDEYPRYPIETLYERQGDCEDTSILMAALLKESGYEVGFLHLPGHLAVVLRTADDYTGGAYYEIDGHRYLYIESTASGWNIGDIPEDVMNQPATFYAIP